MCGIYGYVGKKDNASDLVLSGLKTLEYRGYDSWGIAYLDGSGNSTRTKKISVIKKTGIIDLSSLPGKPLSHFAFGHTRWATHGGVTKTNAHPHLDCTGRMAIIHNGIIENYDEIKTGLLKSGHKIISQTDSEIAVHLIEENYRNLRNNDQYNSTDILELLAKAVRQSFLEFTGLNAIILMETETHHFIAAKNGSPLVIGRGKGENYLSSDAHALPKDIKEIYYLEDMEMVVMGENDITVYNITTGKKKEIKYTSFSAERNTVHIGNYSYFMEKEIYDQVKIIKSIAQQPHPAVKLFANLISKSYGTYLVGCGTAAYACLAGTYLFSKIAQTHVNFSVGSEFGYLIDFLTSKSLVLSLSQSGETIDVIEAVKKAKNKKAKIGTLVNVYGSSLYRLSDYKLLLGVGVEKAVVSTKAFTAKLAYLILIAYNLVGKQHEGRELLIKASQAISLILQDDQLLNIKKLAEKFKNNQHIYIIGRGISYPIALETALKIKEASYIHAEGFAAGELKHGVIALVEKGVPCIAFLPNDETYGANLAGAMEMKARGGYIIGISYKSHEVFDYYIPVTDCQISTVIPMAVVGQLLGYFFAITKKINPDMPRNLAKSVTVK